MSRLDVLRSIDKLDRLGPAGVWALLTLGRHDESGAFTEGCNLTYDQARGIMISIGAWPTEADNQIAELWEKEQL